MSNGERSAHYRNHEKRGLTAASHQEGYGNESVEDRGGTFAGDDSRADRLGKSLKGDPAGWSQVVVIAQHARISPQDSVERNNNEDEDAESQ